MIVKLGPTPSGKDYSDDIPNLPAEERWQEDTAVYVEDKQTEQIPLLPSNFVEFAFRMPKAGRLADFTFKNREYLRTIYDSPAKRKLLMAGRQVEKSVCLHTPILMADGSEKPAKDIRLGDRVATMLADGTTISERKVVWVSQRYTKPCVRIHTDTGKVCDVAKTHPMRLWERWADAGNVRPSQKVAAARRSGSFTKCPVPAARAVLTAYYLCDDALLQGSRREVTSDRVFEEFNQCAQGPKSLWGLPVGSTQLSDWLEADGLLGKKPEEMDAPTWAFQLSKSLTALFLNKLWDAAGEVSQEITERPSLRLTLVSLKLASSVQRLMLKFGIPTKIKSKRVLEGRYVGEWRYYVYVVGKKGVVNFFDWVGLARKKANCGHIARITRGEDDSLPKESSRLIRRIFSTKKAFLQRRGTCFENPAGPFRRPPSLEVLQNYADFFEAEHFDRELVEYLRRHIESDLFWDRVSRVEDLGVRECVDFEVEETHNFIAGGLITHNSTLLGNMSISYMALQPFFRVVYVSPSHTQTKVFSRDRIKEPIDTSPFLKQLTNSKLLANIFEKKLINHSQITMRFAFLNADRVRGNPADKVIVDEFQDILLDNVPVIEECCSHSEYKLFLYAGTPKSLDNAIEHYWMRYSTQNEWVVPCDRHGTPKNPGSWHWNILDETNIGEEGLICDKCEAPIRADDPRAQWASLNPDPKVEKPYEGYRIPQLMVPWIDFEDIRDKQKKYSRAKFYNEVLGRSYDSGTRPLVRSDVQRNCWSELSMTYYREVIQWSSQYPIFMGVDWGSGEGSFSVMVIGGYLPIAPDFITWFYAHRFEGVETEPRIQLDIIKKHIVDFNVRHVGVDYGGGFWPNDMLLREFGAERIKKYQWVGNIKKKVQFEPRLGVPRYLCHRTEVMSDIFNAIKRANVYRFPRWEEFEDPYAMDMLNIFSEYNDRIRMNVYRHAPGYPDDTFHAIAFGTLASFFTKVRPDIIIPSKEVDRDHYDPHEENDII
jgi:hypothetical protein